MSEDPGCSATNELAEVQVDVASTGLVAVCAEALLDYAQEAHLFIDGPGIDREQIMEYSTGTTEFRSILTLDSCGTTERGSWLVFLATPGQQTYKLHLGSSDTDPSFALE